MALRRYLWNRGPWNMAVITEGSVPGLNSVGLEWTRPPACVQS